MSDVARHHQLLVIGGGLAGLRAAVEAKAAGIDVAVLSQVHPARSHSGAAQGGINAALANHPEGHDDTPMRHAFDTVKGSDYLADQDAVVQMTADAPGVIFEMDHWGCPFSRLMTDVSLNARSAAPAFPAHATAPTRLAITSSTASWSAPTSVRSPCTWRSSSPI